MSLITRTPITPSFPLFNQLSQELNRLWENDFPAMTEGRALWSRDFAPSVDIKEEADHYLIKADIPGVDAKNLKVTMVDDTLTLEGRRESEREEKGNNYTMQERSFGSFYRSFTLPRKVDANKISAKHQNGVLTVHIPIVAAEQAKPIMVKVE